MIHLFAPKSHLRERKEKEERERERGKLEVGRSGGFPNGFVQSSKNCP